MANKKEHPALYSRTNAIFSTISGIFSFLGTLIGAAIFLAQVWRVNVDRLILPASASTLAGVALLGLNYVITLQKLAKEVRDATDTSIANSEKMVKDKIDELAKTLVPFSALPPEIIAILNDYVIPDHLKDHPLVGSTLSDSLRALALSHWRKHNGGDIPVTEDFYSKITVSDLDEADRQYGLKVAEDELGNLGNNTSIDWLKFTIDSHWNLRPIYLAKPETVELLPLIGKTIVTDYEAFRLLIKNGYIASSQNNWYQPLPDELRNHAIFGPILNSSVKYLLPRVTPIGRDQEIQYRITKDPGMVSEASGVVNLVSKLNPLARDRITIIDTLGLREDHPDTERIVKGVLQIYNPEYVSPSGADRMNIVLTNENKNWWEIHFEVDYLLPVKATIGPKHIWTQTEFEYPMARVSTCDRIIFSQSDSLKSIALDSPSYHVVLGGRDFVVEKDNMLQTIIPKNVFLFPGDAFNFRWKYTSP